jgi:hypothetical protein
MKKYILQLVFALLALTSDDVYAQQRIQGSLVSTGSNTVKVKTRSNTTFSGMVSNVQFTIQIPTSVGPQPTVEAVAGSAASFLPGFALTPAQTVTEGGFYTYLFNSVIVGAPSHTYTANVEYDMVSFSISGISTTSNVRLSHLADGGSTGQLAFYVEIGGNDFTNYTSMFYGAGATNGGNYSALSFVVSGTVAPVNFLSFAANKVNNNADLRWAVSNETNLTSHYNVERSTDAVNFAPIMEVPAQSQNGAANYNLLDEGINKLNANVIYYRIKQVDTDGKFVYSDVRFIKVNNKTGFITANPNPVIDITNLRIDVAEAQNATLQLLDANGKQILTESLQLNKGLNTKQFDMSPLAAGVYILKVVTTSDNVLTQKIVKQ